MIPGQVLTMDKNDNMKKKIQDFPGGPVAKTPCSHAGVLGSRPGQGARFHMLQLRPGAAQ